MEGTGTITRTFNRVLQTLRSDEIGLSALGKFISSLRLRKFRVQRFHEFRDSKIELQSEIRVLRQTQSDSCRRDDDMYEMARLLRDCVVDGQETSIELCSSCTFIKNGYIHVLILCQPCVNRRQAF